MENVIGFVALMFYFIGLALIINYCAQILSFCLGVFLVNCFCSYIGITNPVVIDVLSLIVGVAMFRHSLDNKWFSLGEFWLDYAEIDAMRNIFR